ncbi:MAG: Mur ligase family protein [Pseudomonadota bacterium]
MESGKSYFLVGIGGSGMMPLAMILAGRGARVAGSDRSLDAGRLPAKFGALSALGIALHPQDGSGVGTGQVVVASAAVEDGVPDIVRAAELGCERMTRAELNAALFNASALPIGVAGTSGKSTVTGMIGWILSRTGRDPTVMNGAVMTNFATENVPFASALVGSGEAYVSEVDESDGSIALYTPRIAVLNNVSLDHKSLAELNLLFADFLAKARIVIVNADNPDAAALALRLPAERVVRFSIEGEGDLIAQNLVEAPFAVSFDLRANADTIPVQLKVPGRHNVANALAALGAAQAAGVPLADAAAALAGFSGLKRRFELVGESGGVAVIDDFGHNPDKIAATLATLHAFPGRLLLLFRPHGYGPLKVMRRELAAMFAAKLRPDDRLVVPDPAYFGGTTDRSVGSAELVADIRIAGGPAGHIPDRQAAADHLVALARPGDRIVVMGARDDTLSELAADMLEKLAARV